jgi:hypothetical protein
MTEQLSDAARRSLGDIASHINKAHLWRYDVPSIKARSVKISSSPITHQAPSIHRKGVAIFALIGALALGGSVTYASTQSSGGDLRDKNLTVSVEIDGLLPGFTNDELSAYVSQQMTASHITSWHFEPGSDPAGPITAQPANRIVWHFKQLPYAGGGIRYIGPATSKAKEVFGVGRAVSIDAKIYLNGQFQATTFDQVTIRGGPHDSALSAVIQKVIKSIVANAMAEGRANGPKQA